MNVRPQTEFRHHVLSVAMTEGEGRPILDRRGYEKLAGILRSAAANDDVRAVLLRGLAGCFCLGGDFSEFLDASKHQELVNAVTDLFRGLATFPKPIIACVNGDAVGVGCTVLFHCDMVIASNQSTFRVPFVDFGLVPDAATSILAPRRMGYMEAFRFFCMGETLDAKAAKAAGFLSDIVEAGLAEDLAMEMARNLARKPVRALAQTRDLLRGDCGRLCERIDEEISLFREALQDESTLRRLQRIARLAA